MLYNFTKITRYLSSKVEIEVNLPIFFIHLTNFLSCLISDMKRKSPSPFTWYFNGILQTSYTMKKDSHVLCKKDGECINLQGGISDNVHYLSNAFKNKVNIFISNVSNWGVYKVVTVIMALHALKEG